MTPNPHKTRVVQSVGDPGKWQAQYLDPHLEVWCDIGDAQEDKADAEAREQLYREFADRPVELPPMKWHRREQDGAYVSDAGYVIYRNGENWVSNRSDTEPIPGWSSHSTLTLAKVNCEQDRARPAEPTAPTPTRGTRTQPYQTRYITGLFHEDRQRGRRRVELQVEPTEDADGKLLDLRVCGHANAEVFGTLELHRGDAVELRDALDAWIASLPEEHPATTQTATRPEADRG